MFRFTWPVLIGAFLMINGFAQSPAPSSMPSPSSAPTPGTSATASPSPSSTPTTEELVDSLGAADLRAAITLLKSNFTNPDAINETELNRATLQGLLIRMPRGLMVLPQQPRGESRPAEIPAPFYSEIFEGHVGYLRLGALTSTGLKAMDKKLGEFVSKNVKALIIDLRDSPSANDFAVAAEFAKRFCPKGKLLFTLRKPAARQDRAFNSDRDPTFQGLIAVLADGDTAGGAEALAGALRFHAKALIIGQPTAGRAVEYSDLPLPSGKILRVAVTEAVLPEGQALFSDGVKPDLPVEMSMVDKRQIFQLSAEKGVGPFVYEAERPHLNEAALLAGTNPELDAVEAQRRNRGREKQPARDPVLQRAFDLVTSLEIYQKR
jgi:hypothetical protein